jgi:hypothetical protein
MGTDSSSPDVKRPLREEDYSHPSRAEAKNTWRYTSIRSYGFMAWCLIEDGDLIVKGFVVMKMDEAPCILVDVYRLLQETSFFHLHS